MSLSCKDFLSFDIFVDFACEIGGEAGKDKNSLREKYYFSRYPPTNAQNISSGAVVSSVFRIAAPSPISSQNIKNTR